MDSSGGIVLENSNLDPRDDMEFDSHEGAYEYYKEYAKSVGFGTAKLSSRRSRASKEFIDAKFSCIRYGNKQQSDEAINPRPSPKIGCKASMHVKRKPNGKWYIHRFVKEHNHELLPDQAHFFRSHRNRDSVIVDSKARKKKVMASMSKQFGAYQFSGTSLENLIRNQHDRGRCLSLEDGGSQVVLEFCTQMHEENPNFFHSFDFNEEHRLRNVFWVDAKGVEDFTYFGDVVSFDTTYYASKYKIPLAIFVGVNNHIQPTLLGCALMADETVYTYVWLMKTWCLAIGGQGPKIMLTDQSETIKAAVSVVFPETRLFFHMWHVLEKIPRQLDYLSIWHDTFLEKFKKCIYRSWNEEQFEKRWWKLLDRFNLRDDEWTQSLYVDRKHWVPIFLKDVSFAGLSAASRSESLNAFFDRYIHEETSLRDLIGRYKSILEDRYEEEAKANFDAWHETPELKSPSPFEKLTLHVYTHEIFKKFQMEVLGAAACHLKREREDGSAITYGVKDFESNQEFLVLWNELNSDIYCSCHSYEYKGYLCRHAIVVLQMSGVFSLPSKYILQRWTNAATSKIPLSEKLDEVQAKVRRYNDLCRRAIILGEEGSLSQDSYINAVGAIQEALKQCANSNNPSEGDLKLSSSATRAAQDALGMNHDNTVTEHLPKSKANNVNKGSKRVNYGNNGISNKKGKVPLEPPIASVGAQGVFQHMVVSFNILIMLLYLCFQLQDMAGGLDYPTMYPRFLTTLLKVGEMSKRGVETLGEMLGE